MIALMLCGSVRLHAKLGNSTDCLRHWLSCNAFTRQDFIDAEVRAVVVASLNALL